MTNRMFSEASVVLMDAVRLKALSNGVVRLPYAACSAMILGFPELINPMVMMVTIKTPQARIRLPLSHLMKSNCLR